MIKKSRGRFKGEETISLDNGKMRVEVLLADDGQVVGLKDSKSGINFLDEKNFQNSFRGIYPYGLTTWVKTGEEMDQFLDGVHSRGLLGYRNYPSYKIAETNNSVSLSIEKNGALLEKKSGLNEKYYTYQVSVKNLDDAEKILQIEQFLVWTPGKNREDVSFVLSTQEGLLEYKLHNYADMELRAYVPNENWGSVVDCNAKKAVIFTFENVKGVSVYVGGFSGEFGCYTEGVKAGKNVSVACKMNFCIVDIERNTVVDAHFNRGYRAVRFLTERRKNAKIKAVVLDKFPKLFPKPKQMTVKDGRSEFGTVCIETDEKYQNQAERLKTELKAGYGLNAKISEKRNGNSGTISLQYDDAIKDNEGYGLYVENNTVKISARSIRGINHGISALLDIADKGRRFIVPNVSIKDYPDFNMRGLVTFPSGRNAYTLDRIFTEKFLIRQKMNCIMRYIDPSAIRFEKPLKGIDVSEDAVPEKEVRAFKEFLDKHGIGFIPCFSTANTMCGNDMGMIKQNFEIIDRLCELFNPKYFNISHDELGDIKAKMKCSCCKDKPNHVIFVENVMRYRDYLNKKVVRTLIWGDMPVREKGDSLGWLDDKEWVRKYLPKDVILIEYNYSPLIEEFPHMVPFKEDGFEHLVTPWATERNVLNYARYGKKLGILGMIGSSWNGLTEKILPDLEGIIYQAGYSWNVGNPSIKEIDDLVKERARKFAREWKKLQRSK